MAIYRDHKWITQGVLPERLELKDMGQSVQVANGLWEFWEKKREIKKKILIGIIYIGGHEHIPLNPLHRHDLIGLPNILTRKWGGRLWLYPSGQKPHPLLLLVARSGWNTFIQGNKLRSSLLPLNMWVNKFAFPRLRPYNSQNNLSEMLGLSHWSVIFSNNCWFVSQPLFGPSDLDSIHHVT